MSFASNLKATAKRLLAYYGNEITVTRSSVGNYDETTGQPNNGPSLVYIGWGNQTDFSFLEKINNTILDTDIKFLFASDTRPLVGDIMTIEGIDMRIEKVNIDNAQNTDVLYTLMLRVG